MKNTFWLKVLYLCLFLMFCALAYLAGEKFYRLEYPWLIKDNNPSKGQVVSAEVIASEPTAEDQLNAQMTPTSHEVQIAPDPFSSASQNNASGTNASSPVNTP